LPAALERRPEHSDETRALDRATIERQLTRKDVPLREKILWRMLYETAARAAEILALNIATASCSRSTPSSGGAGERKGLPVREL
jgi:integrase